MLAEVDIGEIDWDSLGDPSSLGDTWAKVQRERLLQDFGSAAQDSLEDPAAILRNTIDHDELRPPIADATDAIGEIGDGLGPGYDALG